MLLAVDDLAQGVSREDTFDQTSSLTMRPDKVGGEAEDGGDEDRLILRQNETRRRMR